MPSPGRQVSGMVLEGRPVLIGVAGCGIPPTSRRATTRRPGGRAARGTSRRVEGCPRAARVVGLREVDGMPHEPRRGQQADRRQAVRADQPAAGE